MLIEQMALSKHNEKTLTTLKDPSNEAVFKLPGAFSLESSSLWKKRNQTKGSGPDKAPRRKIGIILHVQPNITSAELTNKSVARQKLQSNSSSLPGKSLLSSNGYPDVPEETAFIVPHSAPPEIIPMFPAWPSPQMSPPPGAEFFEWTNGTTKKSTSPCHQPAKLGEEKRRDEGAHIPCFKELPFPDDVAPKGDITVREHVRKPPFHLPPLDPSVFEKKSKSLKPGGKKKKHRDNQLISMTDSGAKKRKNSNGKHTKKEDDFVTETGEPYDCEECTGFCNHTSPSEKKHPKKMTFCSPKDRSEFPSADPCIDPENRSSDTQQQTLTKARQIIIHSEIKSRPPRRSSSFRQIASSVEVLPSKKVTAQPECSNSYAESRPRVPLKAQNPTAYGSASDSDHSSSWDLRMSLVSSKEVPPLLKTVKQLELRDTFIKWLVRSVEAALSQI